jgi:hypothetical protein
MCQCRAGSIANPWVIAVETGPPLRGAKVGDRSEPLDLRGPSTTHVLIGIAVRYLAMCL